MISFLLGRPARLKCILHLGSGDDIAMIKTFNEITWSKVQNVASKHNSSKINQSKYDTIITTLPTTFCGSTGYHSSCYKNFTAFSVNSKKANQVASVLSSLKCSTCSCKQSSLHSPSSSGVLPRYASSVTNVERKLIVNGLFLANMKNTKLKLLYQASQWSSSEIQKKYRQKMDQDTEKFRKNTEKFIEIQNFLHLFKGKVMYQGIFLIYFRQSIP